MLTELGYRVLESGSGGAALDVLDRELRSDLIIIDFAMPGMNGAELARLARAKRPKVPVLFVTGFADEANLVGVKRCAHHPQAVCRGRARQQGSARAGDQRLLQRGAAQGLGYTVDCAQPVRH